MSSTLKGGEKMSVKIRLRRTGAKKNPFYRIVVADSRFSRDGRFIEEIGYYNPLTNPKTVKVNDEKALKWMSTGAKPTEAVNKLFKESGLYSRSQEEKEEEKKNEGSEE